MGDGWNADLHCVSNEKETEADLVFRTVTDDDDDGRIMWGGGFFFVFVFF